MDTVTDIERLLLKEYVSARTHYERLKEQTRKAKDLLDFNEEKLITFLQDVDKKDTGKHVGIGKVIMKETTHASCLVEDKERLIDYLRAEGRDDMIREDVHHKTLESYVRQKKSVDYVEQYGVWNEPDFIKVYQKKSLALYKDA